MIDGYKQLACSVILRAVDDYREYDATMDRPIRVKDLDQRTAYHFLRSSKALDTWAMIAGMDATAIREALFGVKRKGVINMACPCGGGKSKSSSTSSTTKKKKK